MNPLDKFLLCIIHLSYLDPTKSFNERMLEFSYIDGNIVKQRIEKLVKLGFVELVDNIPELTFLGRDAIKVVLVGGVFDVLHPGHIITLKAAKAYGDILVVVIATTRTATKIKKERKIYHDEILRKDLVSSLKFVDLAIIGNEGTLFDTVEYIRPNTIALGYDQAHNEKDVYDNCKKRNLNVQVIRLNTPIPDIKSSNLKIEMGENIYRI